MAQVNTKPLLALSLIVTSLFFADARPVAAQIVPGEQVRLQSNAVATVPGDTSEVSCEGFVSRVVHDTAVVQLFGKCGQAFVGFTRVVDLRVERNRGSRFRHFGIGLGSGILAGGLGGRIAAGDGCRIGVCSDGDLAVMLSTIAGAAVGGIVGGAIGLALPAGRRWVPVPRVLVRFDSSRSSP